MVSLLNQDRFNKTVTLFGLSSDEKPSATILHGTAVVPIKNGSIFYEMDTSDLFIFDEDNSDWIKQG